MEPTLLEAVVFKKNKCYYITSLACYVDLTVDITELSNCKFLILQLQLRGDVVFDMVEMNWRLEKLADLTLYFAIKNLEEINTLKTLNFFMLKIKNQKTYIFIQHTKS